MLCAISDTRVFLRLRKRSMSGSIDRKNMRKAPAELVARCQSMPYASGLKLPSDGQLNNTMAVSTDGVPR